MAGPWERYAAPQGTVTVEFPDAQIGPWSRYGTPPAAEPQQPAGPPQPPMSFGERFATGLGDLAQGGAQLAVNALPDSAVNAVNDATAWVNRQPVIGPITRTLGMVPATREQVNQGVQDREAAYRPPEGVDWGRTAGQVVASLPAALALPTGGSLAGSLVAGAATGAGGAALQPVTRPGADFWDEKVGQMNTGAAIGAVTGPAGYLLGRTIAPNIAPEVRQLADEGVRLTPGQIVGGVARRVEDAAQSIPVVGDSIRTARIGGMEDFGRAVANRVTDTAGVPRVNQNLAGRDLMASTDDAIRSAYERVLPRVQPFTPDQQFAQDMQAAAQRFLTPDEGRNFVAWMRNNVFSRTGNNAIDGQTFKTIESELGRKAASLMSSGTEAEREAGRAYLATQQAFRDLLARTNPAVAPDIQQINAGFAMMARMQQAAGMQGAKDGVFSPAQLSSAVRASDRTARHGGFARGDALLQDLSDAGQRVMSSQVPDSGTPLRSMVGLGALGAGGMVTPGTIAGGMTASAMYSPLAQRLMQQFLLAQRGPGLQAAGTALANSGGAAAVPLGALLLSPPPPERLDQRR